MADEFDDDSGFDDLEVMSGSQMAAHSAAQVSAADDGGATEVLSTPSATPVVGTGAVAEGGEVTVPSQETPRSTVLRELARSAGYTAYTDDDDDEVVMREFGAALEEVRQYQSPEFQAKLAAIQRYESHAPEFEAWRQAQAFGHGGATPAPGGAVAPVGVGQPAAPPATAADPNDPFAPWNQVPDYNANWESTCVWNPTVGRYVYRKEFVDELAKVGAIPDQTIPQKLTAYKEWEANHGREVIRNLPKLLEAHSKRSYEGFRKQILEELNGNKTEEEAERRLSAVVASDLADYVEVDGQGRVLRDANNQPYRKPLGVFFGRRSDEARRMLFPDKDPRKLTARDKTLIHNYAKPLAHADHMIWQAQQQPGTQPAQGGATQQPPAQAATAQSPAAAPQSAAPAAAAAKPAAQKLPADDPQRRFLDGAMEEARQQSNAAGGRDANLRRSQNDDEDGDDDHDFSETYDDSPKKLGSRLAREHAQAGANGFARR